MLKELVLTFIFSFAAIGPLAIKAAEFDPDAAGRATGAIANSCQVNRTPVNKQIILDPYRPSYFISMHPDGNHIGIISGNKNYVIDTNRFNNNSNGTNNMVRVPGKYDPVFTPDGRYLTTPYLRKDNGNYVKGDGGLWYRSSRVMPDTQGNVGSTQRTDGAVTNVSSQAPIHKNVTEGNGKRGVYQSIGKVSGSAGSTRYRYLDDSDGLSIVDVRERNGGLENHPSSPRPVNVCPNTDFRIGTASNDSRNTPMLSKDGKYMSILNENTGTTQIYRLPSNPYASNPADRNCHMVMDMGYPTGKVDFSYDTGGNLKLAFHVEQVKTTTGYFNNLEDAAVRKETYVVKVEKQNAGTNTESWKINDYSKLNLHGNNRRLRTGSYYPRFDKNGNVAVVTRHDDLDGNDHHSVNIIDTDQLRYRNYTPQYFTGALCGDAAINKRRGALATLGWLWANTCTSWSDRLRLSDSLIIPDSMTSSSCRTLVEQRWGDGPAPSNANCNGTTSFANVRAYTICQFKAEKYKRPDGTIVPLPARTLVNNFGPNTHRFSSANAGQITKDDLLAACPPSANDYQPSQPTRIGTWNQGSISLPPAPVTGTSLFENKCVYCHGDCPGGTCANLENCSKDALNPQSSHSKTVIDTGVIRIKVDCGTANERYKEVKMPPNAELPDWPEGGKSACNQSQNAGNERCIMWKHANGN